MVFAAIKHCPTIGGTLAKTPGTPSGAIAVVPCTASDSRGAVVAGTINAVAVVATNTWLAFRLANSLSVQWTLPASTSGVDSAQILAQANALAQTGAALVAEPAPPTGLTPATYAPVIEAQVAAALGTPDGECDVHAALPRPRDDGGVELHGQHHVHGRRRAELRDLGTDPGLGVCRRPRRRP